MLERLKTSFGHDDVDHLAALADVWSVHVERVIKTMLTIWREEDGTPIPEQVRHEAVLELARLRLWLETRVIERNTQGRSLDQIDPAVEWRELDSAQIKERIGNTARVCADGIWLPLVRGWHERFPALSFSAAPPSGKLIDRTRRSSQGVRVNHFSAVFSNRYWASGPRKQVRVYSRDLVLDVSSRDVGYRTWGQEPFLYSPKLERLLSLIDNDGATPYKRILAMKPLGDLDQRRWVAFLLAQLIRTPSFHLKQLQRTRAFLATGDAVYSSSIRAMRLAYETLFTNNDLFAWFYRMTQSREWKILSAPEGREFIRADKPALVLGATRDESWRLLYPMTPTACFAIGPRDAPGSAPCVPRFYDLDPADVDDINRAIASSARRSVMAAISPDDTGLLLLLRGAMRIVPPADQWLADGSFEFWGGIA